MDTHPDPSSDVSAQGITPSPRRRFLGALATAPGTLCASCLPRSLRTCASSPSRHLRLQGCRIAGSHYYDCDAVLPQLRVSDVLRLRRQRDNPCDEHAVELLWHSHKLGYLPRLDNAAASSLLDRAHRLHVEIIGIDDPVEEWEPVKLRIWVEPDVRPS